MPLSSFIFGRVAPWRYLYGCTKAATGGVLRKMVFLKISQNPQDNTCA